MTQQPLPDSLISYLEQRGAAHADAVTTMFSTLTDRERALIKDAAAMGYVRGRMHPEGEPHPKDSAVLVEVIDACLAFPDLYPAINAHLTVPLCTECGHTGDEHEEGDDPVTPGICAACPEDDGRHDYEPAPAVTEAPGQ
ncbi:hypothetical protein OG298_45165 (plasmid) [Streptomyces sp. NBC_01005]|uniref:hypothetical protein n=1 Tax=Streptomyces sp. NBC_01005 TaxID=2903715 RepID=UPI002F90FC1B|nr:hypothetical protein OG298_45165 [Streptomyces sp. NBC_01005]